MCLLVCSNTKTKTKKSVSKYTWCLRSTEIIRLIRDGEKEVGKRESIHLSLHCHHQNDLH